MKRKRTRKDHVIAASEAHCDLNIFAAVQALMENSLVTARSYTTEQRIIKICREEQQRCLRRYDRAISLATKS